jgi:hypothetical protein
MTPGELATTRDALHALAEHVLAAARYRSVGRIGLEVVPGGFATPAFGDDATVIAVVGREMVVRRGGREERAPVTTLRAAGELAGIVPGAPANVYPPVTPCDLDAPLALDPDATARLWTWYSLGDDALRRFRAAIPDDEPSGVTLWPEHLDVAIRAAQVNYGVSPGDDESAQPYIYVGPDTVPANDAYWNQPFGASRAWEVVRSAGDAVDFFQEGRAALGGD